MWNSERGRKGSAEISAACAKYHRKSVFCGICLCQPTISTQSSQWISEKFLEPNSGQALMIHTFQYSAVDLPG
jgi:hypothetical protein